MKFRKSFEMVRTYCFIEFETRIIITVPHIAPNRMEIKVTFHKTLDYLKRIEFGYGVRRSNFSHEAQ